MCSRWTFPISLILGRQWVDGEFSLMVVTGGVEEHTAIKQYMVEEKR
jgi:hypothetical protein